MIGACASTWRPSGAILRHFTSDDVDSVVELDSDPEVLRYLGDAAASRDVVERTGFFAAIEKASGAFTGWFEFRPLANGDVELGYRLRREFWAGATRPKARGRWSRRGSPSKGWSA